MSKPRISIVIPFHWMDNWQTFLLRCLDSIERQTFKDYEVILTNAGSMPVNSNQAIQSAKGEIIKILYMDDYLYSPLALENLSENFKGGWYASACIHDDGSKVSNLHFPLFEEGMFRIGANLIGSPSVVAFENNDPELFDERMSWMLDLDLYRRLYKRYGAPTINNEVDIAIGVGPHQTTHKLSDAEKEAEVTLYHGTTN